MKKHPNDWQILACVPPIIKFGLFLFFIIASSNIRGETQTDQIWSQMTEEQKKEAILNYYQQQMMSQSPQNQSTEQQCPDLQVENARLQQKLQQDEVVFLPPAF
ncbi:hypothetical protein PN36_17300 [Candidatus Thiomargarita nelsonii]|uniref:Uncharacterized protein n=1 Tax=Candidatus Thiomargarita nelsonii TaxID=1003181 RepID=A0A0A6PBY2_9GAMM|nr:hypothetical protein PN36_17300 [Candidatus Thiomargarita nelsonii]